MIIALNLRVKLYCNDVTTLFTVAPRSAVCQHVSDVLLSPPGQPGGGGEDPEHQVPPLLSHPGHGHHDVLLDLLRSHHRGHLRDCSQHSRLCHLHLSVDVVRYFTFIILQCKIYRLEHFLSSFIIHISRYTV